MNNATNITRVNVSIPNTVITEVKRLVPRRGVSRFFSEAIKEKLERTKREQALKELIEDPTTTIAGITDPVAYVRALRATDDERDKRLGL